MKLTDEQIAKVCHEANRAYCNAIGDTSQVPWDMAPDWQRESAVAGVCVAIANPDATPESQHESWRHHKEMAGWVWGPTKNPDTREHPCMVPYSELPEQQKAKDHLFLAIVRALAG